MIRYNGDLSIEVVEKLIKAHEEEQERYKKLQRYYEGKNDILDRKKKDPTKPNNKLVSGYPSYIVDLLQGYVIGKPVTYSSVNDKLIEQIQDIFNYNDEQDENSELAKKAGIKGKAYEVVYVDEEGFLRFNEADADNVIMVYDTKINPEVNFAIRYYSLSNPIEKEESLSIEVYTKDRIYQYRQEKGKLILESELAHYFGQVPVIEYLNNEEAIGDFERVISVVEAYDKAQSDSANDNEEFTDAFLCLVGMAGTSSEDIEKLKEDKVLLLDEAGQAFWLTKQINDAALENYKNRLNSDLHKFAKVPDMSDENFVGNSSGIAMAYKLIGTEQVAVNKERKFKRALQKRLELIVTYLNIKGGNYDYREINIQFSRNIPVNVKEQVEIAQMLKGIASESTALSQLPMVDDVTAELEKMAKDKAVYTDLDNLPLEDTKDDTEEVEE